MCYVRVCAVCIGACVFVCGYVCLCMSLDVCACACCVCSCVCVCAMYVCVCVGLCMLVCVCIQAGVFQLPVDSVSMWMIVTRDYSNP